MSVSKMAHSREVRSVTIDLPVSLPMLTNNGETVFFAVADTFEKYPAFAREYITRAGLNVLGDIKGDKGASAADKFAARAKRVAGWESGSYTVVDRADSKWAAMESAYITDIMAGRPDADAKTASSIRAKMTRTTKDTLGKDTKDTFANFCLATATNMAKRDGETRTVDELNEALIAKFEAMAEAAKAAADAGDDFELPDLTI